MSECPARDKEFRNNLRELDHCPRCIATQVITACGCSGQYPSYAVPRSYAGRPYYSNGHDSDMGFFCKCCLGRYWGGLREDTQEFLRFLADNPDAWLESCFDDYQMRHYVSKNFRPVCKAKKLGTKWTYPEDETRTELTFDPNGADWPIAGDEIHYGSGVGEGRKRYRMSKGIASIVKSLSSSQMVP